MTKQTHAVEVGERWLRVLRTRNRSLSRVRRGRGGGIEIAEETSGDGVIVAGDEEVAAGAAKTAIGV